MAKKAMEMANASDGKFAKPRKSAWVIDGTGRSINSDDWPDWDRSTPWLHFKNDGQVYLTHGSFGASIYAKDLTWAMDGGSFQPGATLGKKIGELSGKLNIQVKNSKFSCRFTLPPSSAKPKMVVKKPEHHDHEEQNQELKERVLEVQTKLNELIEMLG